MGQTTSGGDTLQKRPLTELKGVGSQLAIRLEKLGLHTLQDLLFHLPYQYLDRTKVTAIGRMRPNQYAVIEGESQGAKVVYGKRRSLVCRLQDDSGSINLRFYHFNGKQQQSMSSGARIRCFGEARIGASGLELYHPEYQLLSASTEALTDTLTPCYHITEGITQARLRLLIDQAFTLASNYWLPDLLPAKSSPKTLLERLHYLHFPPKSAPLEALVAGEHDFQQQLIEEELLAYQLSLLRLRQQRLALQAPMLAPQPEALSRFKKTLSFTLTQAQTNVISHITDDIARPQPMSRLLQGDVGSGKTLVAAMAALQCVANHYQVAIMVPTDILAEQHRASFEAWFNPFQITIATLSSKQKVSERKLNTERIASGEAQVIIGTHALFQNDITFYHLGLVIIDEQHRFGVHQRLQLRDKGRDQQLVPHQLIMTATPIPRTLAMSAYADLDYSVIDELPKGRIPVETVVISQSRRQHVIDRIRHACLNGRQAYWVCTLIEQSEHLSAEAAEDTFNLLKELLPTLSIGLVHGRLKSTEKETVMQQFKTGQIQLLVATTVIEVGVNVPNASLMIIENPERLGLAQLHQLRGRVGRGTAASHCVLLYGESLSQQGKARLQAMRSSNDGFRIAEIDLELRGPGEVLGTRQTGDIDFKMADLQRDGYHLPRLKKQAEGILQNNPKLAEQLIQRWIGHSERFAQV